MCAHTIEIKVLIDIQASDGVAEINESTRFLLAGLLKVFCEP